MRIKRIDKLRFLDEPEFGVCRKLHKVLYENGILKSPLLLADAMQVNAINMELLLTSSDYLHYKRMLRSYRKDESHEVVTKKKPAKATQPKTGPNGWA